LKSSTGNILFIILIAVALFAALFYAVSQSMRSGTGNTVKETATINSSVLSQYTASTRASVQRMVTENNDILALQFNQPNNFGSLTSPSVGIFHPNGGGIIYQAGQSNLMDGAASNPSGQWVYSFNFEVDNIGTSLSSNLGGNDLIAFLIGIKRDVCLQANNRLGVITVPIPTINSNVYGSDMLTSLNTYYVDDNYVFPSTENIIGAGVSGYTDTALSGKAEGCYFESVSGNYVYYAVIAER